VKFAFVTAEKGSPIQRQKDFTGWQLDEIERKEGVRPSKRKAKEQLEKVIDAGRLCYVMDNGRLSGFYCSETHSEIFNTVYASAD